jgi:tetratricopeptide (TPR) repeat protein/tRNA A-37 threonylcarbamoyl transferase component Bud32
MAPDSSHLGGRYFLHEQLGMGSAGMIYRATDRLTGQTVALKRVTALVRQPDPIATETMRLTLINEFQMLASLHHPNIIGVLDYGFDLQRQPYFTMEYLHGARTILEAGAGRPVSARVDLLIQVLEALIYLHRLGILHRDLKPSNVLVVDGVARVMDFGLSVPRDEARGTVGTFAYMAPEVLLGNPASEAADLYAVGTIAYELFAGCHPFDLSNLGRFINGVLNAAPDLAALGVEEELAQVIDRLLAKDPASRHPTAEASIVALSRAVGRTPPEESAAIRESFLQAARFVGRWAELHTLTEALDEALAGHGSAWLVGGESGIGKSRLLDELRTRALVRGALVLRGQAVAGGGPPYQLWREPLRQLALTVELSPLEAAHLKPVVPDIDALLGCEVAGLPELGGRAGQQRLLNAIVGAFLHKQQQQGQPQPQVPMLVILEDLQWVVESLDVLRQLTPLVPSLSLLVVGSFRDEERPDLPDLLPGTQVIKLERLSESEIAELSTSMLGEAGRRAEVLTLLQRETEGNAFFLVEVVRALAQEAGRLSSVGDMALPTRILPHGIETIVRRRLERVPADARSLLLLTAIAGRQIDLRILAELDGRSGLGDWLTRCANAAVLEYRDGRWRFAHDKLRDGLLSTLDDLQRVALHRRVALAIERAYPGDPEQAAALADHWRIVGDRKRERHYTRLAGEHAAAQFANAEAVAYLSRAIDLVPDAGVERAERFALLLAREQVHDLQGEREAQRRDLAALKTLAGVLDDGTPPAAGRQGQVALRQANYAQVLSDYPVAIARAQEAIARAQVAANAGIEAGGYLTWGVSLWRLGDLSGSRARLERALVLAQAEGMRQLEADSLRGLGTICYYVGDYGQARAYYERSLPISRAIGNRPGEAGNLSNLGEIARSLGDHVRARGYYGRRLNICREIGDRQGESIALANLSLVSHTLGEGEAAREYALEMLQITRQIGHRTHQGYALNNLGHALAGLGHLDDAADAYRQAVALRRELGEHVLVAESLAGLARVCMAQDRLDEAQAHIEEILSFLETRTLDGTDEPLRVYLTCYHVLKATQDPRAETILATAHNVLQERAGTIVDEELRRSFLRDVSVHREIVDQFSAGRASSLWRAV